MLAVIISIVPNLLLFEKKQVMGSMHAMPAAVFSHCTVANHKLFFSNTSQRMVTLVAW